MRRLALLLVIIAGFLALVLDVVAAEDADTLYTEGSEAIQRGEYPLAYEKLSRAFKLKQSVDIAANLALAEIKLGKKRDAAEHLAHALRTFPAKGDPERKKRVQGLLDEQKKELGEVSITTEEGAVVKLGGTTLGVAPLPGPIFLDPGTHVLSAEKGGSSGTTEVRIGAGESKPATITLSTSAPSASASASASAAPSATSDSRPAWPAILLGGTAAAGAGAGIGLLVASDGQTGDVEGTPCPGAEDTCPASVGDAVATRNALSGGAVAAFVVAGLASAGLITYLVWPSGDPDTVALWLVPVVTSDTGGIMIGGQF